MLGLAVAHIPHDRVADVLEVAADLVGPARDGPRLDPRVAARDARLVVGDLVVLEPRHVRRGRQLGLALFLGDRMVHRDRVGSHAAHQREVALLDPALGEGAFDLVRGLGGQPKNQHAARATVEPVRGVYPLPRQVAGEREGGDAIGGPTPVHHQARRLAHDQERGVAIQHG